MGDASAATRNLRFAKLAAESGRYDDVISQISRTEVSLRELSDTERAPFVAELSVLREQVEQARGEGLLREVLNRARRAPRTAQMALDDEQYERVGDCIDTALRDQALDDADQAPLVEVAELRDSGGKRNAAASIVRSLELNFAGYRPGYPDQNAALLERATEVLDSDQARQYLEPEVVETYRAQVAALRDADATGKRQRVVDSIVALLKKLGEQLAPDAVRTTDESTRASWASAASRITEARETIARLPQDDPDAAMFTRSVLALEAHLNSELAAHERAGRVDWLTTNWARVKREAAGWELEQQIPTWEDVWDRREGELMMPRTIEAIRRYSLWLDGARDREYRDDPAVLALIGEATELCDAAVDKLQHAFENVLAGGMAAPMPSHELDVEQLAICLVHCIDSWFGTTRHLEDNRRRIVALHDSWTAALAAHQQEALDLYNRLTAEANAAWPAIEASISIEIGFDPMEVERWRNRTVRFSGVYNRLGWDYKGDYDFVMVIHGVPIAGHYETAIAEAVKDVERRTRSSIDDHRDVIGVILGRGVVTRRNVREIGRARFESWDPIGCVVMKIIALHAGPIAMGPP